MSMTMDRCVLFAEIVGAAQLHARLQASEALHALERCRHRLLRAVESGGAHLLLQTSEELCAAFERCDDAVHAASEMLERVAALPPIRGLSLGLRVSLHWGEVSEDAPDGCTTVGLARMIAAHAEIGQALATEAVLRLTTPAMRNLTGMDITHPRHLQGVSWPVYGVGGRVGRSAAAASGSEMLNRLEVRYQSQRHVVDAQHPVLMLGRAPGNDVVLVSQHASRQHARIEWREDGYYLVDSSANGTWLSHGAGEPQKLLHQTVRLEQSGVFGCGHTPSEGFPVYFRLL